MHFVDRGPEPESLNDIRIRYTPNWVNYYIHRVGKRPTDKHWIEFTPILRTKFSDCCGYCETRCRGTVDHYRPISQFPHLVYVWDNWVFSCFDCNNNKLNKWHRIGYIDPCSTACKTSVCPFIFDFKTGEVLPNPDLSSTEYERSEATIEALKLNLTFRAVTRLDHIHRLNLLIEMGANNPEKLASELILLSRYDSPLSSLTRYYISKCLP